MNANSPMSARWLQDFSKQLYRRRNIILYGNIHDQFLWRGAYQNTHDFLQAYFQDLGFALRLRYDPVDGFAFAQDDMRQTFDRLAQQHAL